MAEQVWIDLEEALPIAGKATVKALTRFVERWNSENPDHLIYRIPKCVDKVSLKAAVRIMMERHTPGMQIRNQVSSKRLANTLPKGARN